MDIYQASLKYKGKKVETHSRALDETDVEANNVMIADDTNAPVDIKDLMSRTSLKALMERLIISFLLFLIKLF